ncbi:LysE/ArgO family amino acid transporter [Helicobacter sp.]|uniref:LysE/ArgO family amino acid transporter n=1 Tax=Helicobacter sp. TaxID=218 RepID=UPI0025B9EBE0|nr:LysE/ArgO family amino acid transporter [Helicobacter sp.]MCI5968242.1 LysE/ArgO family amino acid transporter [Helicobacter sp.]MDY2585136.1 LysE/ArgO family amino acid transporter [Helicobacter sp.]
MEIYLQGLLIALSLFATIGAQNMFVIKQGILKNHIFFVCITCIICDIVLVSLGIFGVGEFLAKNKIFTILLGVAGTLFVLSYGILSLRSAFKANQRLELNAQGNKTSLVKVITQTLAITLLNPHVYLDTILILGAIALPFSADEKLLLSGGIISASCLWFLGLGFAAHKASVLFKNPKSWVILNSFTAFVMFIIAYMLANFTWEELQVFFR